MSHADEHRLATVGSVQSEADLPISQLGLSIVPILGGVALANGVGQIGRDFFIQAVLPQLISQLEAGRFPVGQTDLPQLHGVVCRRKDKGFQVHFASDLYGDLVLAELVRETRHHRIKGVAARPYVPKDEVSVSVSTGTEDVAEGSTPSSGILKQRKDLRR